MIGDDEFDDELSPLCRSIIDGTHQNIKPKRDAHRDEIAALTRRIAKLEAGAKRGTSRNKKISKADMELMAEAIGNCLGQELQPLQKRIEKLEQRPQVGWAGTWHEGAKFAENEIVTFKGGLWLCIEPTSASWTSGCSSFTSRYASITPSGSFHGSNRETCVSSGRVTSIPNWSTMYAASSGDNAMFFGASGSIAGGQMNARSVNSGGT